jgi:hypothetical protein
MKSFAKVDVPYYMSENVHESTRINLIQDEDTKRKGELNEIIAFIRNEVTPLIQSRVPTDQHALDEILRYSSFVCLRKYK